MGFFKSCFVNCLASCCLVFMSAIAFTVFDLGGAVTGGLFVNVGDAITGAFQLLGEESQEAAAIGSILVNGFAGLFIILMFPLHWLLYYRPDEAGMALAMMIPWILAVFITALIFSKNAKEGFYTGLWLGGGFMVAGLVILLGFTALLTAAAGEGGAAAFTGAINGFYIGLTDLNPVFAIFFSCLEGGLVGSAFGALGGAMKYKPEEGGYQPKTPRKSKEGAFEQPQETLAYGQPSSTSQTTTSSPGLRICPNCNTPVDSSEAFCTNCGNKL